MSNKSIYLDNAATTSPCQEAIEIANIYLKELFYNPSSPNAFSLKVANDIKECRSSIANLLKCNFEDVFFTPSATYANNIAILSSLKQSKYYNVISSAIEHPSVKNVLLNLSKEYNVLFLPVNENGFTSYTLQNNIKDVALITVMHINNEVGVVNDINDVLEFKNKYFSNAFIHVDGVQSFLKTKFNFSDYPVNSYSISAHKVHGLKGIGVLATNNLKLKPIFYGGGQEGGINPGTENTLGIATLLAAINHYKKHQDLFDKLFELKTYFYSQLKLLIPNTQYLGPDPYDRINSSPHILCVSINPLRSDLLINALSEYGILCSSGSACGSKKQKVSETIKTLKIKQSLAESAVRFSFSVFNTKSEIDYCIEKIYEIYNKYSIFTRR